MQENNISLNISKFKIYCRKISHFIIHPQRGDLCALHSFDVLLNSNSTRNPVAPLPTHVCIRFVPRPLFLQEWALLRIHYFIQTYIIFPAFYTLRSLIQYRVPGAQNLPERSRHTCIIPFIYTYPAADITQYDFK